MRELILSARKTYSSPIKDKKIAKQKIPSISYSQENQCTRASHNSSKIKRTANNCYTSNCILQTFPESRSIDTTNDPQSSDETDHPKFRSRRSLVSKISRPFDYLPSRTPLPAARMAQQKYSTSYVATVLKYQQATRRFLSFANASHVNE